MSKPEIEKEAQGLAVQLQQFSFGWSGVMSDAWRDHAAALIQSTFERWYAQRIHSEAQESEGAGRNKELSEFGAVFKRMGGMLNTSQDRLDAAERALAQILALHAYTGTEHKMQEIARLAQSPTPNVDLVDALDDWGCAHDHPEIKREVAEIMIANTKARAALKSEAGE